MKAKLNLTIERDLLSKIKEYAVEHNKSVSQIVEEHFESISRVDKKESFVEMIRKLKKPDIPEGTDFKKEYYEAKAKNMASKIFLDANVILEYILERKNADIVDSLFVYIETGKYKACTSTSVLQICSYWIEKAFGVAIAKTILLNMLNKVAIIDASQESVISALHSSMNDIEDALQYYTAMQHKMDYFITLDKKLVVQAIPSLPIYLPSKFLDL